MSECMSVRIPKKVVDVIKVYQKAEELSSFGLALEFYIRQAGDQKMEGQLSEIRADINRLRDAIVKGHKKSNILAIGLQTVVERLGGKDTVVLDEIREIDKLSGPELRK